MTTSVYSPNLGSKFNLEAVDRAYRRNAFGDKRLEAGVNNLLDAMVEKQTSTIQRLSLGRKKTTSTYRLLRNEKVALDELIHKVTHIPVEYISGKDLLVIIDGTSIALGGKRSNKEYWQKEAGVLENNLTPGFFAFPALVVNRNTKTVIGLAEIGLYSVPKSTGTRQENARKNSQRSRILPFEEKLSSIWSFVCEGTVKKLKSARSVMYVMDQGGDCADSFDAILSKTGHDLLVRTDLGMTRSVSVSSPGEKEGEMKMEKKKLYEVIGAIPFMDGREVKIRSLNHYSKSSGKRVKRKGRKAYFNIRYTQVKLDKVTHSSPLYIIEVKESAKSLPEGEKPIHWVLLTSHKIESVEDAWRIVGYYSQRWTIEQVFRVLKAEGFNVGRSELDNVDSIKKIVIMALKATVEAMQLVAAREGKELIPIEIMFDDEEQKVLSKLCSELEGNTEKQKNPHASDSLAWAAWIIAMLGGWSGYVSQRPPGPSTMHLGLERFRTIYWGYSIMNDLK